ncbi:unnamed protein product [Cylindrotheca closterium]|uniref:Uncharacterized protein n=1 Tax=Cylindrotheca closterium TaxID=2856 RepID=A0AAD2FP75_9STRA|nr:unnamed protein product [Cylindrotheca closterium]
MKLKLYNLNDEGQLIVKAGGQENVEWAIVKKELDNNNIKLGFLLKEDHDHIGNWMDQDNLFGCYRRKLVCNHRLLKKGYLDDNKLREIEARGCFTELKLLELDQSNPGCERDSFCPMGASVRRILNLQEQEFSLK